MDKPKSNLPMLLTIARLAAAPVIGGLIVWAHTALFTGGPVMATRLYGAATILFVLAALSDWLDGHLARRLEAISALGAALDHATDKVLVAVVLMALAYAALPVDLVVAGAVLIGRDLLISGLRERFGAALAVDQLGKAKAAAAMAGVGLYLAHQTVGIFLGTEAALLWGARTLLWGAALLSLWSGARYAGAALRASRAA